LVLGIFAVKKLARREAKAFDVALLAFALPIKSKIKSFRLKAGYFSLLAQRKVTKRNGLPRHDNQAIRYSARIFRLACAARASGAGVRQRARQCRASSASSPCLGRKTPHIHVRRPPGLRLSGKGNGMRDHDGDHIRTRAKTPPPPHSATRQIPD